MRNALSVLLLTVILLITVTLATVTVHFTSMTELPPAPDLIPHEHVFEICEEALKIPSDQRTEQQTFLIQLVRQQALDTPEENRTVAQKCFLENLEKR